VHLEELDLAKQLVMREFILKQFVACALFGDDLADDEDEWRVQEK